MSKEVSVKELMEMIKQLQIDRCITPSQAPPAPTKAPDPMASAFLASAADPISKICDAKVAQKGDSFVLFCFCLIS